MKTSHLRPFVSLCGFAVLVVWLGTGALRAQSADAPLDFGGVRSEVRVGERMGFIVVSRTAPRASPRPWVLYAPTLKGRPAKTMSWYAERLLDAGFAICGVDAGEAMGNPMAREVYWEFYRALVRDHGMDPKVCLMGQSRGGLFVYNFAADRPEAVACIVGIYPVCDLRSYPNLTRAAPAYGLTVAELTEQLPRHNPIDRLAPLAAHGIPIFHLHGDADKIVPLEQNSAVVLERYRALGGKMDLAIVEDAGHAEIPAFFESRPLLDFVLKNGRPATAARIP